MGQSMSRQGRPSTPEPLVFNSASGTAKKGGKKEKEKKDPGTTSSSSLRSQSVVVGVNKSDPRFAGTNCSVPPYPRFSMDCFLFRTLPFCPGQYPCLRCVSCASLLRAPDGEEPSYRFFFCDSDVFFPDVIFIRRPGKTRGSTRFYGLLPSNAERHGGWVCLKRRRKEGSHHGSVVQQRGKNRACTDRKF